MQIIEIKETVSLSSPHLFGLLVSQGKDGKNNIMGVSWFSFASLKPPKMIMCLGKKGYTSQLIKETKNFTLCLPTEPIKEKALLCCSSTGRSVDKAAKFDIDLVLPQGFAVPVVKSSKIAWQLTLDDTIQSGDHNIIMADIVGAVKLSDDKSLYAFDGYKDLRTI